MTLVGCSTCAFYFARLTGVYLGPQTLIHESLQAQRIVKPSLSAQHFARRKWTFNEFNEQVQQDQQVRNMHIKFLGTNRTGVGVKETMVSKGPETYKLEASRNRPIPGKDKDSMTTWKTYIHVSSTWSAPLCCSSFDCLPNSSPRCSHNKDLHMCNFGASYRARPFTVTSHLHALSPQHMATTMWLRRKSQTQLVSFKAQIRVRRGNGRVKRQHDDRHQQNEPGDMCNNS